MTPLLCCRNWDIWRKISPQLGLQRTWRHVRKKSGGNRNWKLWRWHCCGDQQSCRAGWRKLFRSSYLLLIRDRKKKLLHEFWWILSFPFSRCTWALVVVLGSSGKFPTMVCQLTWSTTHALFISCFSYSQSTSSIGLVRRNSMPCMTTPCTP